VRAGVTCPWGCARQSPNDLAELLVSPDNRHTICSDAGEPPPKSWARADESPTARDVLRHVTVASPLGPRVHSPLSGSTLEHHEHIERFSGQCVDRHDAAVCGGTSAIRARGYFSSSVSLSGRFGNGAWGSVWYQKAVEEISSCSGRYRPPDRQPSAWMVTFKSCSKRMGSIICQR
jgi:hypothetical protein